MTDLVDRIIAYESDELDSQGTVELFSALVKSGQAWQLQGHYGRTAATLIEEGILTREGEITEKGKELF